MQVFDNTIREILNERLLKLEESFDANVIFYYGEIHPYFEKSFRDFIEKGKEESDAKNRLAVILNTPGGSVETVEKMVSIIRFHYNEVYFVVPDYAMSAGTILCMSGNRIYMDYSSSLGPIDPQVYNGKEYVPALGYLDQVEKLLEKAKNKTITQAEFLILQNQDLAMLSRYEQAKNLTVTLLKKWLVEYKFHDWDMHHTTVGKKGKPVTKKEKEKRAEEIARQLGDNKLWHSHGRMIGINTLTNTLKLQIEDYSKETELRTLIRSYNDLIVEYIRRANSTFFLHSKNFF
ncbi:MAG: ATP-dependent Clp protease proteolytic subunit [Deltaproteobacteria bacterium]|nr:ATP-dependent Clp protease proteolytic subunit [Deltaproteobacteria bacterium]